VNYLLTHLHNLLLTFSKGLKEVRRVVEDTMHNIRYVHSPKFLSFLIDFFLNNIFEPKLTSLCSKFITHLVPEKGRNCTVDAVFRHMLY